MHSLAKRLVMTVAVLGLVAGASGWARAGLTINEGFEGSSYDLATQGSGTASISTSVVHSGNQSIELGLTTSSDYGRVKLDVSSYGVTLGQITSADYFVNVQTSSSQAPYIIFSINTPGSGGDSTLAVMYNDPGVSNGTWTDIQVNSNSVFHIEGDTTGLINPSGITLGQLEASTYSPGVSWGSFGVDFVRIGLGLASNDGLATTAYVDDLTINTTLGVAAPEPSTLVSATIGLLMLAGHTWRRRKRA